MVQSRNTLGNSHDFACRHGRVLRLGRAAGSPELVGKPVIARGTPEKRGVVSAAH